MLDVAQWDTPDRFFAWPQVQRFINRIDAQVYHIAVEIAQEQFLNGAKDCPNCGRLVKDLFWFSIASPESDWSHSEGSVGFLTLCEDCQIQVDFFVDDELTDMQAEEFARSRSID